MYTDRRNIDIILDNIWYKKVLIHETDPLPQGPVLRQHALEDVLAHVTVQRAADVEDLEY